MLGKKETIAHLEVEFPKVSKDGQEFRFAALSLSNWGYTARRLLKENQPRKVAMWNLDCVGSLGIPTSASIDAPVGYQTTFYDLDGDGHTLRVLGAVTAGFSAKLMAALDAHP
jgi:hypothetical protein